MTPIILAGLFKAIADTTLWGDNRVWWWNITYTFRTWNKNGLKHRIWVIPFDQWHLSDNLRTYALIYAGLWVGECYGAVYPIWTWLVAVILWAIQGTVFLAFFHVIFKRRPFDGLKEWYRRYFGNDLKEPD